MMSDRLSVTEDEMVAHSWSQRLQRRVMRLLLQHDEPLFYNQFRQFFVESALPQLPLFQQYDQYVKLRTLSNELLDDILPRIRRQLSLKTSHARLREESPTRGDIDWPRTIERNWGLAPGLVPLQFETRLRKRSLETPENVLTVAILLAYRQELQRAIRDTFVDEELSEQERRIFVSADERVQRELAAPYARALVSQASSIPVEVQATLVMVHMRPGPNPYRDLLAWWQRFSSFRAGRASEERTFALASRRADEKVDAWLYELWIMLESIHLLHSLNAVQAQDVAISTDRLQCIFTWQQKRLRLIYNRQLDTATSYVSDWQHAPSSRPDYAIEREEPLEIRYQGELIWREAAVILDAKYYLSGSDPTLTHGPIKKLLGDMTLLGAHSGALFFPLLSEPEQGQEVTRIVSRTGKHYYKGQEASPQVHLYHLEPAMSLARLQKRLGAVLDMAVQQFPERSAPACHGIWLDADNINISRTSLPPRTLLCPKPHIGPDVHDLVNVEKDCLKNPLLCHVMGQSIVPPFVVRVATYEQLAQQSSVLRTGSSEQLQRFEQMGDEESQERLRQHIFTGVGRMVERYVKFLGNAAGVEENFERWVFGSYWKKDIRSLSETARNALVSGEQVWQSYQEIALQDWASPAIQYCRALEFELKRRLYEPCSQRYPSSRSGFTLGTITYAYTKRQTERNAGAVWDIFLWRIAQSGSSERDFEHIAQRIHDEGISEKRNQLAHGTAVARELASTLRESVIGNRHQPGILCWLAEHLAP